MLKSTRPPRCRHCRKRTEAVGRLLHDDCIQPWIDAQAKKKAIAEEKKKRAEAKVERARTRQRKEAIKTIPDLIREAQTAFNAFIRERDRTKGCFVCGCAFPVGQLGGDFDAGHVRSRGAASHLRFHEDNCHGECKSCNAPTGAKPHEIKAGAIRRIGEERFAALEDDNAPHKWTREELTRIRDHYRAEVRRMKKEMV